MIGFVDHDYERLTRPLYSYAETDRLAKVTPGTSSRWLKGYAYQAERGVSMRQPPVTPTASPREAASFMDLIEVVAIGRLREQSLSLPSIRALVRYCQEELEKPRPLVTETFRTDGREVFIKAGKGHLLEVGKRGGQQVWDEVLAPFLKTIDYHHELARRWWPLGREAEVVVDPDYGFGMPVISGSGIRTEIIAERHRAGDSDEEISRDFGVSSSQIEDALHYEVPEAA